MSVGGSTIWIIIVGRNAGWDDKKCIKLIEMMLECHLLNKSVRYALE